MTGQSEAVTAFINIAKLTGLGSWLDLVRGWGTGTN